MKFTKMQGLGNDYVYLDCTQALPENLPELARQVSRRHFGVGADGLICICPSAQADFRMRMWNADGSEGEMCGNGIRCVGKFVYDKGMTREKTLTIETLAGVKQLTLTVEAGQVSAVTVDMGQPVLAPPRVLTIGQRDYRVTPVSMGNPHIVLYPGELGDLDLPGIGPLFECHPSFPQRTNTEFVQVQDAAHLRLRVWERGSGETLACGTGACAALVATVQAGRCDRAATVQLLGGDLFVRWDAENHHVYMTGPAVTVFEGEF